MQVTSNFDIQKKNYKEVAPHNHRVKSKTKNDNIDWSLTKYDILRQHPFDFKKLMINHWGVYSLIHDLKRIKSGHSTDTYGDYSKQKIKHLTYQVLKSAKGKTIQQKVKNAEDPYLKKLMMNSVRGMFYRKNKTGYRTIETGFGRGTNHKNQIGSDRRRIWKRIKQACPEIDDRSILKSEAHGLDQVPGKMNQMMPGFRITDYDVHVDEKKNYFGQAHLQGRIALLGKTKKGKPSFNLNNSIKASVTPHKELLKQLDKKYYPKNYKTKKDHMNFRNNIGRFHAFNMLASYITFRTEARQLEHDFPKANLDFHLIRTYSPSVSHEEYMHQQDQKRETSSAVDRATTKAKMHFQRSYAKSSQALESFKASMLTAYSNVQASTSSATRASLSLDSYASAADDTEDQIVDYSINRLESAFHTLDSNHSNKTDHYQFKAEYDFKHGLNTKNGIFSNVALVSREASLADQAKSKSYSEIQKGLQSKTSTFDQREIKQYQSALDVIKPKASLSADYYYHYGSTVSISGKTSTAYGADAAEMSIPKADAITKKRLQKKIKKIHQEQKRIKDFKKAKFIMMKQQFSLLVPKKFHVKGLSRKQIINEMANGSEFSWAGFGDRKSHSGFDLESHFVGFDLQHNLDAKVQAAKNEADDYEKNGPEK